MGYCELYEDIHPGTYHVSTQLKVYGSQHLVTDPRPRFARSGERNVKVTSSEARPGVWGEPPEKKGAMMIKLSYVCFPLLLGQISFYDAALYL